MVIVRSDAIVYLDTNALIYLTEGSNQFKSQIEVFLRAAVDARARLVTSELAITEVLVSPIRNQDHALLAAYNELFESFVRAVPIERTILIRAASMRATVARLRTPDAIHSATAEHLSAAIFLTGDADIPIRAPMVRFLLSESKPV